MSKKGKGNARKAHNGAITVTNLMRCSLPYQRLIRECGFLSSTENKTERFFCTGKVLGTNNGRLAILGKTLLRESK